MKILNFYNFIIEKVQDDWFEKNPDFYLSKNNILINNRKKENVNKEEIGKLTYNKTVEKEITDYNLIEMNKLKNISYEDIFFRHTYIFNQSTNHNDTHYTVYFKDKVLEKHIKKHELIKNPFFRMEHSEEKVYFGHLKNRYHADSIDDKVKGIGLGYKIYKSFVKKQGYITSDEHASVDAKKLYYNLLKDPDIFCVIDKNAIDKNSIFGNDTNKVLLIWKDYDKIEQLIRIIRKHELAHGRKYEYDKELLKYIKNIK